MKKKLLIISLLVIMLISLSGCGIIGYLLSDDEEESPDYPPVLDETVYVKDDDDDLEDPETAQDPSSEKSYPVQDLNGNTIDLVSVMAKNKVTLINIWGTFCGPCINEMPDLAALYKDYNDEGFGIIGFTCDVLDEYDNPIDSAILEGLGIISYTGVTYPVIRENMDLQRAFETSVVPTSFFVDSNGNVISETYYGSKSYSEWESLIKEMLDKVS